MKKFIIISISITALPIFLSTIVYLAGVFYSVTFNIAEWGLVCRRVVAISMVFFMIIGLVISILAYVDIYKNEEI